MFTDKKNNISMYMTATKLIGMVFVDQALGLTQRILVEGR